LAFSPKIRQIDLTDCFIANTSNTVEALYKLIKISVSIESLLLGGTNIVSVLSNDFYKSLGESRTMKYLNLDYTSSTSVNPTLIRNLGMSCAMNNFKDGCLTHLSLNKVFGQNTDSQIFFDAMYISDRDHEFLYGDKKIAEDMTKDQLVKKLHCGLKYLNLSNG
jgi:hypothetical protein